MAQEMRHGDPLVGHRQQVTKHIAHRGLEGEGA